MRSLPPGWTTDRSDATGSGDAPTIEQKLRELHALGIDLNARSMEDYDITLITAARRRFDSWDAALTAAGLDYRKIVLRAPFKRRVKTLPTSGPSPQHREESMEAVVHVRMGTEAGAVGAK